LAAPIADHVVHLRDLKEYPASYHFPPCAKAQLNSVCRQLKSAALTDDESRRDFRAQLKMLVALQRFACVTFRRRARRGGCRAADCFPPDNGHGRFGYNRHSFSRNGTAWQIL
jgi:hypothetical protein